MLPDLSLLRDLVRDCAREELLPRFAEVRRRVKLDGSLVTEADVAMQRRMQRELARRWPEYDLLGEEMTGEEHRRLAAAVESGMWCLDPLDGTPQLPPPPLRFFCFPPPVFLRAPVGRPGAPWLLF